jgi:hypothetical protein
VNVPPQRPVEAPSSVTKLHCPDAIDFHQRPSGSYYTLGGLGWDGHKTRLLPSLSRTPIFFFFTIIALFPQMHASNLLLITSVAASLASGATFPLQKKADLFCPSPSIPFCCTRSLVGYEHGKNSYLVGCTCKQEKRESERIHRPL